jgi:predicted Rossmann fold flavoprotein
VTRESEFDVLVVGGGPAGITAAIEAAKVATTSGRARRVALVEKASRVGVKVLISGGNRCNLTHDCDAAEIAKAFGRAGAKFLGPALRELGPRELRAWVESLGVPTKVEPGGKVFPVSNRAVDVRDALERELHRVGVTVVADATVTAAGRRGVTSDANLASRASETHQEFVVSAAIARSDVARAEQDGVELTAPRLVLALGGRSYPKVGTTGDGYALLRELGHAVTETRPALVPLIVEEPWVRELTGLTLEDVELTFGDDVRRGSTLFTHFGLSGPAPMNLGGAVATAPSQRGTLTIDFLPGRARRDVETRLRTVTAAAGDRPARALVAEFVPRRLAESLCVRCGVAYETPLAQTSKGQRAALVDALFATKVEVTGTRGFDFAEVTRGGLPLDEVDAATMESRRVPRLFVCGELLDLDGPIGGYNFTAAFATGALAGRSAARGA